MPGIPVDDHWWLTAEESAARYNVSVRTWHRWVKLGLAPPPAKIGTRWSRWPVKLLDEWEESGFALAMLSERDRALTDQRNKGAKWTPEPSAEAKAAISRQQR